MSNVLRSGPHHKHFPAHWRAPGCHRGQRGHTTTHLSPGCCIVRLACVALDRDAATSVSFWASSECLTRAKRTCWLCWCAHLDRVSLCVCFTRPASGTAVGLKGGACTPAALHPLLHCLMVPDGPERDLLLCRCVTGIVDWSGLISRSSAPAVGVKMWQPCAPKPCQATSRTPDAPSCPQADFMISSPCSPQLPQSLTTLSFRSLPSFRPRPMQATTLANAARAE